MKTIIQEVLIRELKDYAHSIKEIDGLGSVNQIFDVTGNKGEYIFRLNDDPHKKLEYQKEQ